MTEPTASGPGPACSLHAILAPRSTRAVVFRRGPSKQTCLIAWDREHDTFEVGQWFKGRVYAERCALSPDGTWLLSFMASFRPPFQTWTALSKPPHFTAIALWPLGGTWGGGGVFLGDREIVLNHGGRPATPAPGFAPPPDFRVHAAMPAGRRRPGQDGPGDGWVWGGTGVTGGTATREGPNGVALRRSVAVTSSGLETTVTIGRRGCDTQLTKADWADLDAGGDALFGIGGRLYRLDASRLADLRTSADIILRSRCLADFTDLRFRALAAPYPAGRPDAERSFAPALDRVSKDDRRDRGAAREAARR